MTTKILSDTDLTSVISTGWLAVPFIVGNNSSVLMRRIAELFPEVTDIYVRVSSFKVNECIVCKLYKNKEGRLSLRYHDTRLPCVREDTGIILMPIAKPVEYGVFSTVVTNLKESVRNITFNTINIFVDALTDELSKDEVFDYLKSEFNSTSGYSLIMGEVITPTVTTNNTPQENTNVEALKPKPQTLSQAQSLIGNEFERVDLGKGKN